MPEFAAEDKVKNRMKIIRYTVLVFGQNVDYLAIIEE